MHSYLDESGDLGFSEDSTEYFTIAFVVLDDPVKFKRCVKTTKQKYRIPSSAELKGSVTRVEVKRDLLHRLAQLPIEVHHITVRKAQVEARLRQDTNILYNYMVGLSLVQRIIQEPPGAVVTITADRRITAITAGFNFDRYIQYKTWFEAGRSDLDLRIHQADSHHALSIQGIDVIANTIYRRYSTGDMDLYGIIQPKVRQDKRLFWEGKKETEVAPAGD
jgi:hypothetical protein